MSADVGSVTPGALMPLCSPSVAPWTTTVVSSSADRATTFNSIRPSSSRRRAPGFADRISSAKRSEDAPGAARGVTMRDAKLVARLQRNRRATNERPGPDLGTAQVLHDRDVAARLPRHFADPPERFRVGLVRPVREVEAEDVHARRDQRVEDLGAVAGRTNGGDDLRLTHSSIAISYQLSAVSWQLSAES